MGQCNGRSIREASFPATLKEKRAGSRIRTDDLLITNQLLYQLSYAGIYYRKSRLRERFRLRFSTQNNSSTISHRAFRDRAIAAPRDRRGELEDKYQMHLQTNSKTLSAH